MEQEIKCPNCYSSSIRIKIRRESVGMGRGRAVEDNPNKEEFVSYECKCCGKEFAEDDLYEQ